MGQKASRRNRRAATALIAWLLSVPVASPQTSSEKEIVQLRELLNLPNSTAVKVASSPSLPPTIPLKVHIVTGLDVRVRENFVRWTHEWNRKEGKRHGALQIAEDPAVAQVILVRYTEREKARLTTDSFTTPETSISPSGTTTRTARHRFSYYQGPIYGYILHVKGPDTFEILWRYATLGNVEETKSSGRDLWEDFSKLLKARGERGR